MTAAECWPTWRAVADGAEVIGDFRVMTYQAEVFN
jgi:hypothetical protein